MPRPQRDPADVLRTQMWMDNLLRMSAISKHDLEGRLRKAAGLKESPDCPPNAVFRYAAGRHVPRDGPGSIIELADSLFPASAAVFRSVFWVAVGRRFDSTIAMKAIDSDPALRTQWLALDDTRQSAERLAASSSLDAGGLLLLRVRLLKVQRPVFHPNLVIPTCKWLGTQWPMKFVSQLTPVLQERIPGLGSLHNWRTDPPSFPFHERRTHLSEMIFLMVS